MGFSLIFLFTWHWPDTVENIDQNQKQSDQHGHSEVRNKYKLSNKNISPSRHHFRLDQETDPAHNDEHEAWQIDLEVEMTSLKYKFTESHLNNELHLFSLYPSLKTASCVRAWNMNISFEIHQYTITPNLTGGWRCHTSWADPRSVWSVGDSSVSPRRECSESCKWQSPPCHNLRRNFNY